MTGPATQTASKPNREALYYAYRWAGYGWASVIIGLIMHHNAKSVVTMALGGAFVIGGFFFAFIAFALSLLGFAMPGGNPRRLFWGPLLVSLPPVFVLIWKLTHTPPA